MVRMACEISGQDIDQTIFEEQPPIGNQCAFLDLVSKPGIERLTKHGPLIVYKLVHHMIGVLCYIRRGVKLI
jgi:hypothetical protein